MPPLHRPIQFEAESVAVAETGDYCQVKFTGAESEERRPYLLLKRKFADLDDGRCYFESGPPMFAGNFRVRSARLDPDSFTAYFAGAGFDVRVTMKERMNNYERFCRILKLLLPEVEIVKSTG
jgi:hypothetical protein